MVDSRGGKEKPVGGKSRLRRRDRFLSRKGGTPGRGDSSVRNRRSGTSSERSAASRRGTRYKIGIDDSEGERWASSVG